MKLTKILKVIEFRLSQSVSFAYKYSLDLWFNLDYLRELVHHHCPFLTVWLPGCLIGPRRVVSFLCLTWGLSGPGMGRVLKTGIERMATGRSRRPEWHEKLWQRRKWASKQTGPSSGYSFRPALSPSPWSWLQSDKHWEVNLSPKLDI